MNRPLRPSRPFRSRGRPASGLNADWTESVVLRSYDSALTDPEPEAPSPADTVAQPGLPVLVRARVVPGWLVAAAVLLAAAATLVALLWWHHRSRVIEVTNRVLPAYPAGPDAAGCPTISRCQLQLDIGQPLGASARRLFPDAAVQLSESIVDVDTDRTVRTSIVLSDPSGVEVFASAQCVPGAAPLRARTASLPLVGPAQADFVAPGAAGCSVAVSAQIPDSVRVPLAQLKQLVDDPDVQLSP